MHLPTIATYAAMLGSQFAQAVLAEMKPINDIQPNASANYTTTLAATSTGPAPASSPLYEGTRPLIVQDQYHRQWRPYDAKQKPRLRTQRRPPFLVQHPLMKRDPSVRSDSELESQESSASKIEVAVEHARTTASTNTANAEATTTTMTDVTDLNKTDSPTPAPYLDLWDPTRCSYHCPQGKIYTNDCRVFWFFRHPCCRNPEDADKIIQGCEIEGPWHL